MSISGTYKIRKSLPKPGGEEGEYFTVENTFVLVEEPGLKLSGTVDTGDGEALPLDEGYYHPEGYFKIIYKVGPGAWEICARIFDGKVEGVVSNAGGGGPNRAEGELA